jgi:Uncharacterised protein family UPF0547
MDEAISQSLSFVTLAVINGRTLSIDGGSDILHFLAIALTVAFLTARIASKKDGSFFPWFVAGALLGIIALPVAIFKRRHVGLSALKKCPKCAEQLPLSTLVCAACDYNFISGIVGHGHKLLSSPKPSGS